MPDWSRDNLLQQISASNRAAEARVRGDEGTAKHYDMLAREHARQERLRLKPLVSPQPVEEKKE